MSSEGLLTEDKDKHTTPVVENQPSQTTPAHWLPSPASSHTPLQQSVEQLNTDSMMNLDAEYSLTYIIRIFSKMNMISKQTSGIRSAGFHIIGLNHSLPPFAHVGRGRGRGN